MACTTASASPNGRNRDETLATCPGVGVVAVVGVGVGVGVGVVAGGGVGVGFAFGLALGVAFAAPALARDASSGLRVAVTAAVGPAVAARFAALPSGDCARCLPRPRGAADAGLAPPCGDTCASALLAGACAATPLAASAALGLRSAWRAAFAAPPALALDADGFAALAGLAGLGGLGGLVVLASLRPVLFEPPFDLRVFLRILQCRAHHTHTRTPHV